MHRAPFNQTIQSCHAALLLDEVIIQIFLYLVENVHRYTWRAHVISAARTCKAWNEAALDFLWRDVDGMQVVWLMGQYDVPPVRATVPYDSRFGQLTRFRSTKGGTNQRVLSLTQRTRKIVIERQLHPSFLIPPPGPGGLWMPHLREIVWHLRTPSPSLLSSITPSVLSVQALTLTADRIERDFLDHLAIAFQNLSNLDLQLSQITPDGFDALLEIMTLHQLPKLRQLRLYLNGYYRADHRLFSGARLMSSLEAHPSLERLSLASHVQLLGTWCPGSSSTTHFTSLRQLEFETDQDTLATFLQTLSQHGTGLKGLNLGRVHGNIRNVIGCVQAVALFRSSLERLKIRGDPPNSLPHDLLTCLGSCRNLKTLDTACGLYLPITDEDLKDLVSDLTQLQELRLSEVKGTKLTLGCLVHLANWCPKLEEIALRIDATRFDDSWGGLLTGQGLGNLRMMHIRDSPRPESDPVARVAEFFQKLGMQPKRLSIPHRSPKYWRDVLRLMRKDQGSQKSSLYHASTMDGH